MKQCENDFIYRFFETFYNIIKYLSTIVDNFQIIVDKSLQFIHIPTTAPLLSIQLRQLFAYNPQQHTIRVQLNTIPIQSHTIHYNFTTTITIALYFHTPYLYYHTLLSLS